MLLCYPLTTTSLSRLSDNVLLLFFTATSLPWLSEWSWTYMPTYIQLCVILWSRRRCRGWVTMYFSTTTSLSSLSDLGRTHMICYPLTTTSLSWLSDNELIIYFFTTTSLPWLSDSGRINVTLTNTSLLRIECPWTCNLPFTYSRVFILFILYYYYICWRTAYVFNY